MYRFLFKPRWLAFHALVVALVVLMVNLGLWQLNRYQERTDFNDQVRARTAIVVTPITDLVTAEVGEISSIEWRSVTADGVYRPDEQVVVINRSQGGSPSKYVITPLELADGRVVLVNRGFVLETDEVPEPPVGAVTVTGRLRASERRGLGGITDPVDGVLAEVHRIDVARIAEQVDGDVIAVYLDALRTEPPQAGAPTPLPDPELTSGSHLSYMVQWFIFSLFAIAGWVMAVRRSARTTTTSSPS